MTADPLTVPCSSCGARAGTPCHIAPEYRRFAASHVARRQQADEEQQHEQQDTDSEEDR